MSCQAPLSVGFPRQGYWSGLPFPPPGYLPDSGIKPTSPTLASRFLTTELPGSPKLYALKVVYSSELINKVFPVVMYGCESWSIKRAEHRRIDAFELWCWRRLLRIPWTARRSNQSTLKEISPGCSLERLMLKLKRQYFGHLMWRTDSLEKTLMLGKIESRRRRGWQRMRWLDSITDAMDEFEQALGVGNGQGSLACCSPWSRKELDTTEWLNWIELMGRATLNLTPLLTFKELFCIFVVGMVSWLQKWEIYGWGRA